VSHHPDLLEIDAVRLGQGRPEHAEHIAQCDECRLALSDLEGLRGELARFEAPPFAIPEEIDRRILWAARKRALGSRRRPFWRRPAGAAAAAALVLAGLVSLLQRAPVAPSQPMEMAKAETTVAADAGGAQVAKRARAAAPAPAVDDVTRDGRVDILDAFALARSGKAEPGEVERIATRAVSLGGA